MLLQCPICGPREEDEFAYGGDASIIRPKNPEALSDSEWADFVYLRENPKGRHRELWFHRFGCRRWLTIERDTVTHTMGRVVLSAEPRKDNTR